MRVRTLVIDDMSVARRLLITLMGRVSWVELVGEAGDGASALTSISTMRPDLLFLDLNLPDMNGLEVVRRMSHPADVVLTTAYDEFAIPALQLGVIDYLLKPFGKVRFREALERVRARQFARTAPVATTRAATHRDIPRETLFVRNNVGLVPIQLGEVHRVEARGDGSVLWVGTQASCSTIGLGAIAALLDPARFVRVHRSHMVNLEWMASMREYDQRRFMIVMKDGTTVVASRAGTRLLRSLVL